jgi:tetratricopeptide (TPR) repeat protein
MFRPRASARSRAAALTVVLSVVASLSMAMARPGSSKGPAAGPLDGTADLSPAQARRAEALAEYATGVSEEFRGEMDNALDRYRRALQLDPQNTALAVRLGQIYATRRDITNALSVLESSVKANPNDAELSYWLGYIYRSDNQNEKAITAFQSTLKLDPTNLNALGGLLDIYALKDSSAEAVKLFDRAFHQKVEVGSYWMRLGDFYTAVSRQKPSWAQKIDRKRIQQCYEKALALAPNDTEIELRLADTYGDNGDFQKAADTYAKLLVQNPNTPRIREREAANYIRADQKEKAAAVLEEIIKREPLQFAIYNYLGEVYEDLGKHEKAISNYQQSLVVNPNQPENYSLITALQLDSKQVDLALQTLATWKEKFPTDFRVPYFSGLIQTDRKQYTEAVASFADAESLAQESGPDVKLSSKFYFSYGAASERAGDYDKAVSFFQKCLQLDPADHGACNYLGYMWAEKGIHLDEALDLIQKAVKLEPDNGAYIDSLGWVLFKLGRNEEALVQLRHAVDLIKDDATLCGHLADVLLKVGKTEEALTVLQHASELEPGNKDISEKLQKLKGNQSAVH